MAGKPLSSLAQDSILINNPIVVSYIDSLNFDKEYMDYYIACDDVYCRSRMVFMDSTFTQLVYSIILINDTAFCEGFWLNGNLRSRDILITKNEDLCPYYITRQEYYCENGNLVWKVDSVDIDKFRQFSSYYCEGSLQKTYLHNPLMGLAIGRMITYHRNGKVKSIENYSDHSKKCGFSYYWNEKGKLEFVKEFDCKNSKLLKEYKIGFFNRRKWNKQYRKDF